MSIQTVRRSFVSFLIAFFIITVAVVVGSTSSQAAMTDYQRQQITQYLHSPKTKMDAGIFDGKAFNGSVTVKDAAAYMNGYIKTLNKAVKAWGKLTSGATGSAEGQALFKELNDKLAFAKAMQTAYPAFQASQGSQGGQPAAKKSGSTASSGSSPSAAATGGMTDYQKEQMTRHLDSQAMRKDAAIFDGETFVAGVPFNSFEQYYQGYMKSLNQATTTWKRQISSSNKSTPDGQALQKRLNEYIAWGNAMNAQYAATKDRYLKQQNAAQAAQQQAKTAAAANKEAHKQQCVAFQKGAMKPLSRDPMVRFINQMLHKNSGLGSVDGVNQHRQVARDVLGVCKSVNYKMLVSQPCFYVIGRPDYDPVNWCNAAARADALIKEMVLNQARKTIAIVGSSTIQSVQDFHKREGWLTFEGPVTFKDKLSSGTQGREAVMGNIVQVLAAAGIDNGEDALWGEQKARLAALRAAVEKTAGSWKSPPKKANNYSTKLAADQIKKQHSEAKVHDAYLSRKSWKIHKNALGVPDRRTLPGYVIFKLADDPYCQLRSYTLTEQYSGGGSYQKAGGVRFGYVRFQDCP